MFFEYFLLADPIGSLQVVVQDYQSLVFLWARRLTSHVSDSHNPFFFCKGAGPEVEKRTCLSHHYLHSSWLHLPEPPPTCLTLLRFMWLYRRRPIQCARPCVGFVLYWQLCVWYCSWLPVRLGPVYLESVISESLKRLGQFSEDKWWIGRTADVGTQTLQDDWVDWSPSHYPAPHGGGFFVPAATAADGGNHPAWARCREAHSHEPLYYSHQNKW